MARLLCVPFVCIRVEQFICDTVMAAVVVEKGE